MKLPSLKPLLDRFVKIERGRVLFDVDGIKKFIREDRVELSHSDKGKFYNLLRTEYQMWFDIKTKIQLEKDITSEERQFYNERCNKFGDIHGIS